MLETSSNNNVSSKISDNSENFKFYLKLSSRNDNLDFRFKQTFFYEDNSKILNFATKGGDIVKHYQFDHIFSKYDNNILIFYTLKKSIDDLFFKKKKNLLFVSFGEEKTEKTKFFFGENNKFTQYSFMKLVVDSCIDNFPDDINYDGSNNINNYLIDIVKISKENFVVDVRNITNDLESNLIDTLNELFKETNFFDNCHIIITIKFFKYSKNYDEEASQREVEVIRTLYFVEIQGFNNSFSKALLNERTINEINNPDLFSLINIKNLFEAIGSNDIKKYCNINSIIAIEIAEILKLQNSACMFFGFIDQNDDSLQESFITLDIINKFKSLNLRAFFNELRKHSLDTSLVDKYSTHDYKVIEAIFLNLMTILERIIKFPDVFIKKLDKFSQNEKFSLLKEFIELNNIQFEDTTIPTILELVLQFFLNRSKHKDLQLAQELVLKCNWSFHVKSSSNILSKNMFSSKIININSSEKEKSVNLHETDEIKSILKFLENDSKQKNNENDINNNSQNNISLIDKLSLDKEDKEYYIQTINNQSNNEIIRKNEKKKQSMQSQYTKYFLTEYIQKFKQSINNIYIRMLEEDQCMGNCRKNLNDLMIDINFNINPEKFLILKASTTSNSFFGKQTSSGYNGKELIPPEETAENHNFFKSTNIRTFNDNTKKSFELDKNNNLEKISEIAKKGELNTIFSNKEKNNKIIENIDKKIQNFDNMLKDHIDLSIDDKYKISNSKIVLEFNDNSLNARKYVDQSQYNKDDSESSKNTFNNKHGHDKHSGGKASDKKKNKNITIVNDNPSTVIKRNPFT